MVNPLKRRGATLQAQMLSPYNSGIANSKIHYGTLSCQYQKSNNINDTYGSCRP